MADLFHLSIREMQPSDLPFAAACTAGEGWVSENQSTLEGFFLNDPHGCLVAENEAQPIGICIATRYEKSGFIGELIVCPEARGKGVGAALLEHGVKYLQERGAETIYLDGVLKAVDLYARHGFRKVCRSWRYAGRLSGKPSPLIQPMERSDLDLVAQLDKASFGEGRRFFLQRRLELFPSLSYVLVEGERLRGYILGQEGTDWSSAGPWVADGDSAQAVDLLRALALEAGDKPIRMGILGSHPQACQIVEAFGFEKRLDSPWRMALGPASDLGGSQYCYAVGSAAKG